MAAWLPRGLAWIVLSVSVLGGTCLTPVWAHSMPQRVIVEFEDEVFQDRFER